MAAVSSDSRLDDAEGLARADFRLTNRPGFGDGLNHYAHSMAWFEGALFVGTTRGIIHGNKVIKPQPDLKPWPVDCPDDINKVPRRTEIWRYNPHLSHWQRVFRSPLVRGRDGRDWPRYIGLRGMTVYQGAGDSKPCLYIATWSPLMTDPPDILRSEDGIEFLPTARPPFDDNVRSFRTMEPYDGRLHTSPTSSAQLAKKDFRDRDSQDSVSGDATIYATDDIPGARWHPVNEEGFGDPGNVTVFELTEFHGRLYAGTVNTQGFQLWRTDSRSAPPYRWIKVLERGAGRGALNECAATLCVFDGALYLGTGIINGGYHRRQRIGPAAAEILRVWPDDSWELLMGASRHTNDGVKVPLSGYGPGFDDLFTGYVWRMCVHAGWLYAGMFSWAMLLPYLSRQYWPDDVHVLIRRWGLEELAYRHGGCMLWRTPDGIRWYPVTRNGFGNPYNWGIRNMVSTQHGLFVGTANPFGPTIAQRSRGKWRYVPNPRGGTEIYLGHRGPRST